jgi:hypothetical protein
VLRDVMSGDRRRFRRLLTESEEGIASNIPIGWVFNRASVA